VNAISFGNVGKAKRPPQAVGDFAVGVSVLTNLLVIERRLTEADKAQQRVIGVGCSRLRHGLAAPSSAK
jgi:hypothetical protein